MQVTAKLRYARLAPQKARLVARLLGGLPVASADVRLRVLNRHAAPVILKLLRSAVANAKENFHLESKDLRVVRVLVNEGPRLKRWMPRARGSADHILKRTSHIEVVLSDQRETPLAPSKPQKSARMETASVHELSSEELKQVTQETREDGLGRRADRSRAVKPSETPHGARRLVERKHGGE